MLPVFYLCVWEYLYRTRHIIISLLGNVLERDIPKVVVTPDTVYMRPDGKITLDKLTFESFMGSDYCAPEWKSDSGNAQTESSLEKVYKCV